MISIPDSLSFAKLMMSSAPAKSAGDARYASQDPIHSLIDCFIQYRLQSVLRVRSFYVERNNTRDLETALVVALTYRNVIVI